MLSVLTQFFSNRSQYVVVDGCRSKLVNAMSGVPQGNVLGPQVFLFYTAEIFSTVENMIYGDADDSTLVSVVPYPAERVDVTPILSKFLSVWCRFVLGVLWNAELCFQPPCSHIGKVLALVMPFFVWHIPYRVLWKWDRRLE